MSQNCDLVKLAVVQAALSSFGARQPLLRTRALLTMAFFRFKIFFLDVRSMKSSGGLLGRKGKGCARSRRQMTETPQN